MKNIKKIISWIYAISILLLITVWAYFGPHFTHFVKENVILVIVYLLPGILFTIYAFLKTIEAVMDDM